MTQNVPELFFSFLHAQSSSIPLWIIGLSGGMDSIVLLHLMSQWLHKHPEQKALAVHLHHGWSPQANQWAQCCCLEAQKLNIPCLVRYLHLPGEHNREGRARQARYDAFLSLMVPGAVLMTAHHANDQMETALLQCTRATAWVKGMPARQTFGEGELWRPLLSIQRHALQKWAQQNNLSWCEDASNLDTYFDRNYLRHQVIPHLQQRWPSIVQQFVSVTQYAQQHQHLLNEYVRDDLAIVCPSPQIFLLTFWRDWSEVRRRYVLWSWLNQSGLHNSAVHYEQFWDRLNLHSSSPFVWHSGPQRVYRIQDALYCLKPSDYAPSRIAGTWDLKTPFVLAQGWGQLTIRSALGQGLSKALLANKTVHIGYWKIGGRFHPKQRVHSQTFKKLWQEWQIPAWARKNIPILYVDDEPVMVAGVALHQKWAVLPHQAGWVIEWAHFPQWLSLPAQPPEL